MTGDRLRRILLVALAVVALAGAAATLDAGRGPSGTPERPDRTPVGPDAGPVGGNGTALDPSVLSCPTPLTDGWILGGVVVGAILLGALVYRVRGTPFVAVVLVGPPIVGLVSLCGTTLSPAVPLPTGFASVLLSTPVLLGVLFAALAGAAALLYVVTGADERLPSEDSEDEPDVDLAAVGRAAGDAADRIERQADVTNEVYRTWLEMTNHLDVRNPNATTPTEFADAAIEAGMAREDVTTLTRLFEEVRYGGMDPGSREERAVDALRRIEHAYAGDRS